MLPNTSPEPSPAAFVFREPRVGGGSAFYVNGIVLL
jgi:hypothetical protein